MKTTLALILIIGATCLGRADTGGPYEAVVDLKAKEAPPVFKIPDEKQPLLFYLRNTPKLIWNKELNEPSTYEWQAIKEFHASVRSLGHVRGHLLLEVRYISHKRLSQGIDHADMIVILAKGQDNEEDHKLCRPIYFTAGGAVYNHTSEYLPRGHKFGAVRVTRHYSGNGGHVGEVFIRGTENFDFERFLPEKPTAEQDGARQPATALDSKPEGSKKPKPESEGRSQ